MTAGFPTSCANGNNAGPHHSSRTQPLSQQATKAVVVVSPLLTVFYCVDSAPAWLPPRCRSHPPNHSRKAVRPQSSRAAEPRRSYRYEPFTPITADRRIGDETDTCCICSADPNLPDRRRSFVKHFIDEMRNQARGKPTDIADKHPHK